MDWLPIIAFTLLLAAALFYGCCITASCADLWALEQWDDEDPAAETAS